MAVSHGYLDWMLCCSTRYDTVLALTKVISNNPQIANLFTIGHLLGLSESCYWQSFLDIAHNLLGSSHNQTLIDFKIGEKNSIISTSVAEEGINIQSCCNIIRWDPLANMVSWAQSRGRARCERSTFAIMFTAELIISSMGYMKGKSVFGILITPCIYRVLTPHSAVKNAVAHLNHFCAVIPSQSHTVYTPIYDIDPPQIPWAVASPSISRNVTTVSRALWLYGDFTLLSGLFFVCFFH